MSNSRFPFVTGITLCPDDTTDYVITGATTFSDDPNGTTGYVDGVVYHTFIRYPDNITDKHEEVWGAYNASTNTIARTVIGKSSAGYGVPVDWNDGGAPKHIASVVSGSELGNMASVLIDLKPWEDILIGGTFQSNGGKLLVYQGSTPPNTTLVKDWSRAVPGTGANAWRLVAKADQYTDYNDSLCYIGTTRSVNDGGWKATGSIIHAFATRLATFMGKTARTISVHRGATSFADPTKGWGYLPSESDAVSKVFKDAVDDAITQLHIDDPRQSTVTKLHIYMLGQGENDASISDPLTPYFASPSAKYGRLVADHISDLGRSDRWNIIDDSTTILLLDIPAPLRAKQSVQSAGVNQFDGHAQAAALIGPRAVVIPTVGIPTQNDQIHYWGEGADTLGYTSADVLLMHNAKSGNTGGTWRLAKNFTFPEPSYAWQTNSASAPSTDSARLNVAGTEIKIHKTAAGSIDVGSMGLGLFKIGDILRFEKQNDPTIYIEVTLTADAVDNSTYFSYACTSTIVGTVTGINTYLKTWNTAFHDGQSYSAATQHNIQSTKQNLTNKDVLYTTGALVTTNSDYYKNNHIAMLDMDGRQYRSQQLAARRGTLRTTDATANQTLLRSNHFEDGRVEYIRARVCYKIPASGNIGVFELHAIIRRTGATTSADWAPAATVLIDEEALATDPNIIANNFIGLVEGWTVRVTGKAATTIDWVCELETIEIPTG